MGKVWKRRWLRDKVAKSIEASTVPVAEEVAPEPVVEEEVVAPKKKARRTRKTKGKE